MPPSLDTRQLADKTFVGTAMLYETSQFSGLFANDREICHDLALYTEAKPRISYFYMEITLSAVHKYPLRPRIVSPGTDKCMKGFANRRYSTGCLPGQRAL